MAISDTQKLDFLWKKIGYGFAKTDVDSVKAAVNESIPSPLLLRGDTIWVDSDLIPSVKPTVSNALLEVYDDTGGGEPTVECVADITASPNRTWFTNVINWIPPEFGSTYQIKVYIDVAGATAPQTTGSQIFASGSGNNDEWFFDYSAGILNFIGTNLPAGISGKRIYITGAVYVGDFGVKGQRAQFGNIVIENNDIFVTDTDPNGDINLIANGLGSVNIVDSNLDLTDNLNVTGLANFDNLLDSTSTTTGSVVVDGGVGIAKSFFLGGDAYLQQNLTVSSNIDVLGNIDFSGNLTIDNRLFAIDDLADGKNDAQENIALGFDSLGNVTSGASFNTVLGNNSGKTLTDGSNNIIIGNNSEASSSVVNNEITLGNESINRVRIPGVDFEITDGRVIIGNNNNIDEENLFVRGSATVTDTLTARQIEGDIDGGIF